MRAVVQRVIKSSVSVKGEPVGSIEKGLVVLIGVENGDEIVDADYMVEKITGLRIFEDGEGKMNLSVLDVGGSILAVSQFTLLGDCRKGKRPNFTEAAKPEKAKALYDSFVQGCRGRGVSVSEGIFQEEMLVSICNDGPVTLLIDSRKRF
ncbi:MAG: D-aminoacyl-tRNA deacylase [Anaerovoracaceae bacterium]|jgi:D-tyrosyl-tRNA(Tyr) deacylase